jgi:hypothetical protein
MSRPTVITPDIIIQLKQAFAIGCTDEEACAYAKIGKSSLYRYIEQHPEFREESNRLKKEPILKAKNTIVRSLDDVKDAQWYLERKKKDEFSLRSEFTGRDGEDIKFVVTRKSDEDKENQKKK